MKNNSTMHISLKKYVGTSHSLIYYSITSIQHLNYKKYLIGKNLNNILDKCTLSKF